MISRRIKVNVAVYLLVTTALVAWVVSDFLAVGPFAPPVTVVHARFADALGLAPGFDVTYLGHSIGRVEHVRLESESTIVTLHVERDASVPADASAAIRRKSAVGEPYVALRPPDEGEPADERLEDGDTIPLARTSVPVSYGHLFEIINGILKAVPVDDLQTLVREVAAGLEGRGQVLQRLVLDTADLTEELADRADLLDDTIVEVTQLTGTVADHAGDLESATVDLADLASTLRASREDLAALIQRGPDFAGGLGDVVATSKDELQCVLDGLGTVGRALDQSTADAVGEVIVITPQVREILDAVTPEREDGIWLRLMPLVNAGASEPIRTYVPPKSLPPVPELAECAAPTTGTSGGAGAGTAPGGGGVPPAPADDDRRTVSAPSPSPTATGGPSSDMPVGAGGLPWLWILLGLAGAGTVGAAIARRVE